MRLPNGKNVIIPKEKLTGYILSETHLTGKFKARFFKKLGFSEENVADFEKFLRSIAKNQEIQEQIQTPFGTKYIIDGEIIIHQKIIRLRTVWIIENNQLKARFVTIYPV